MIIVEHSCISAPEAESRQCVKIAIHAELTHLSVELLTPVLRIQVAGAQLDRLHESVVEPGYRGGDRNGRQQNLLLLEHTHTPNRVDPFKINVTKPNTFCLSQIQRSGIIHPCTRLLCGWMLAQQRSLYGKFESAPRMFQAEAMEWRTLIALILL